MRSELAGLVVHGVGGIGKSTLAAEIAARVGRLEPERTTTIICGEVSVDTFLAGWPRPSGVIRGLSARAGSGPRR